MPGEMSFIPQSPKEAEQKSSAGEQIAECAPEELRIFRQIAVEGHDGKASRGHSGGGAGKKREEREVQRVNEEKNERVDGDIGFGERELASQRTEHREKKQENRGNGSGIEYSGEASRGQLGGGNRRRCGLNAKILDHGKIELRLRDMNFHVLRGAKARNRARSRRRGNYRRPFRSERQRRLGAFAFGVRPARAVDLEPASYFLTPFGLIGSGRRRCRRSRLNRRKREFAERADFHVLITDGATLRAYLNHRFVLRCGPDLDKKILAASQT